MSELQNKTILVPVRDNSEYTIRTYLVGLWKDILRIPQVSLEDDFFLLGGDSALVIEMLMTVSAHFDREFNYNKFFPEPNIRVLTDVITAELK